MSLHLDNPDVWDALDKAGSLLQKSVTTFPLGAISPADFKTTSEKIVDLRKLLINLKTRIQALKVKKALQLMTDPPELSLDELDSIYKNKVSETIITNQALSICHQSQAVQYLLWSKKSNPDQKKKIKELMTKLYILNDKLITNHEKIPSVDGSSNPTLTELREKQMVMKHECDNMTNKFADFLKTQNNIRNEKLKELDPTGVRNKEKVQKLVRKINLMKKLITNFIAADCQNLDPEYVDYLWTHKDLINDDNLKKLMNDQPEI